MSTILLINPNSSPLVTEAMQASVAPILGSIEHDLSFMELAKSPPGIETDEHVAQVIPNIIEAVGEHPALAYVTSCFSDPGIEETRQATDRPVVGIAESAYLLAMSLGQRFGVISLGPSSILRHQRHLERLAISDRLAGDRSIDMPVVEMMGQDIFDRLERVGVALRDEDSADAIVLGCAGLGGYRERLQAALGIPVVDPVQAGVLFASLQLDLFTPGAPK